MKTLHVCNATCFRVIRERQERTYPAVWNSLTYAEQAEFGKHVHISAAAAYAETQRARLTRRLVRTLPFLFSRRQRARLLAERPEPLCPTCGRLWE